MLHKILDLSLYNNESHVTWVWNKWLMINYILKHRKNKAFVLKMILYNYIFR